MGRTSVVDKGRDGNISAGTGWPFFLAVCHYVTSVVVAHFALKNPQEGAFEGQTVTAACSWSSPAVGSGLRCYRWALLFIILSLM